MSQEREPVKWRWQALAAPCDSITFVLHISISFHNVKCTHELFTPRFFLLLCFVIDSIHFILFITMLFIWHDFCYVALSFINSAACYYNLIWVICCFTFTVTWCITLIWCSPQHCVYNRNSMTARHKVAISNLIYSHQYLWICNELRMFWRCSECGRLLRHSKVPIFLGWGGAQFRTSIIPFIQ